MVDTETLLFSPAKNLSRKAGGVPWQLPSDGASYPTREMEETVAGVWGPSRSPAGVVGAAEPPRSCFFAVAVFLPEGHHVL